MLSESVVFGMRVQIAPQVGTAMVIISVLLLIVVYAGLFIRNGEYTGTDTRQNGLPIVAFFALFGLMLLAEGVMGLNGIQVPNDTPAHWVMAFPLTAITTATAWLAGLVFKVRLLIYTRGAAQ